MWVQREKETGHFFILHIHFMVFHYAWHRPTNLLHVFVNVFVFTCDLVMRVTLLIPNIKLG